MAATNCSGESCLSEECFIESLQKINGEYGRTLWKLWVEMGCNSGDSGIYRSEVVLNYIKDRFQAMIMEEEAHKASMVQRIDEHYKKLMSLASELGEEDDVQEPSENLTLIELERALRNLVAEAKEKKKERINEVAELKDKDEKLAKDLDEKSFALSLLHIPTQEERKGLIDHIQKLSELKAERFRSFVEQKQAIVELMNRLNIEPANSFERAIVCEKNESFIPLSNQRLRAMNKVFDSLYNQLERNKVRAKKMRYKIKSIANKLELDQEDVKEFLDEYSGSSPNELEELQFRLDELELLKTQHLERFITSSRRELEDWWDKCFYSQKQRSLFLPLQSRDYTEELLVQHEEEIERIRDYFSQNESLFRLVEQRQALWNKKLELERKAKNPNRFNVKSTEFLKEEKDRKLVEKQLPKIERALEEAIEHYESMTGKPFLVGGVPYQTYMEYEIVEYEKKINKEKAEKVNAKKIQILHESKYGTTPAKFNSSKRKAPSANEINVSKKYKSDLVVNATNTSKSSNRSKLVRSASARSASSRNWNSGSKQTKNTLQNSSFITGSGEFKNPKDVNANSTLQIESIPNNKKAPNSSSIKRTISLRSKPSPQSSLKKHGGALKKS